VTAGDPGRPGGEQSGQEGRTPAGGGISLVPEPIAQADVESQLAGMDVDSPLVGIVMGSKSDMETMEKAAAELAERGIMHEVRVMSAHREPDLVAEYAKNARMRGLKVIIAGAGISAALPGALASMDYSTATSAGPYGVLLTRYLPLQSGSSLPGPRSDQ